MIPVNAEQKIDQRFQDFLSTIYTQHKIRRRRVRAVDESDISQLDASQLFRVSPKWSKTEDVIPILEDKNGEGLSPAEAFDAAPEPGMAEKRRIRFFCLAYRIPYRLEYQETIK